jgi:hypothetical protein
LHLHLREVALQATAYSCSATAWCWGDRLDLHQLRRGHGPRAICFAFCHKLIPSAGLLHSASNWRSCGESHSIGDAREACCCATLHSRSCWWSASESHRSGYLLARQIRVPSPHPMNLRLLTATTRSIRIHWPRLSTTSRLVPPGGLEPPSHRLRGGTLAR